MRDLIHVQSSRDASQEKKMKTKVLAQSVVLGGALILTGTASASYQGLIQADGGIHFAGGANRQLWRIYAIFSHADDYLTGVNGSPANGALVIQTRNGADTGPGTNFFNPGGSANNTAPTLLNGTNEFGTFATIGVAFAGDGSGPTGTPDQTSLSPGFPNFINGASITNSNMGWFTAGPVEQGRAGYAGDGDVGSADYDGDGDLDYRVLMMQLSVNAGEFTRGTVNISGVNNTGLAGGQSFFAAQQTWNIPAPGALALLGLAAVRGTRRRR
jgi:uncharacterized protein (TIGR03382 family)